MNSFLDQLNLTPQERRIVVAIAVVVFVVLNLLLVWPHFSDLARVRKQLNDTRKTMMDWNKEISLDQETNGYKTQLHNLERQQGGGVVNQQPQLINFLFNVGNDPAMIRVHELHLRTADANRYRLKGDAVLTANYAKQTP